MASAVNILIRAKDEASGKMKDVSAASTGMTSSLKGMVGPIAAVAAGFLAWKSISGIVKNATAAFAIQEKAENDLANALRIKGENIDELLPQMKKYAGDLQFLTNIGDEASLAQMKMALQFGFTGKELKGAAQASIALGEAGMKGSMAMRALSQARTGDFAMLNRYIPGLREAKTEAEKLAITNKFMADSYEIAKRGPTTMLGATQALQGNFGDLSEIIGGAFVPLITKLADVMNHLKGPIESALSGAQTWIRAAMETGIQWMGWLMDKGLVVYTVLEVAFKNFGDVVTLTWATMKLAAIGWFETVKHFFTSRLPQIGQWFADNWLNIIQDMFNLMKTIVVNYVKFYIDNFLFLINWVRSGFAGGMGAVMNQVGKNMGTNLIEGFESKTKALPQALKRELTAAEIALQNQAGAIGSKLGKEVGDKLASRRGFFNELFTKKLGQDAAKFEGIGVTKDGATGSKQATKLSATESRFLTRGSGNVDKAQMQLDETKATKVVLDETKMLAERTAIAVEKLVKKEDGSGLTIVQSLQG